MISPVIRYEIKLRFVPILFLLANVTLTPVNAEDWTRYSTSDLLTIYWRSVPGSSVPEFKAVGTINASPMVCWRVITDFEEYEKTMPYTRATRIIGRDAEGGVYVYSVIDPGKFLVSPRDFTIKVQTVGSLNATWDIAEHQGPEEGSEYVRVKKNKGSWSLRPLFNGTRTEITYQVHTDPGGGLGAASGLLPNLVLAWVNSDALPELYAKLRMAVKLPQYQRE